jgi:hypothetical protein
MSTMEQIKTEDATEGQLRDFAQLVLGLDVKAGERRASVLAKIASVWANTYIIVASGQPTERGVVGGCSANASFDGFLKFARRRDLSAEQQAWRDTVRIKLIIPKTETDGGDLPVYVSYAANKPTLIERGVPSDLRYPYFAVLSTAIRTVWTQGEDMTRPMVPTETFAYPCQVLGVIYPPEEMPGDQNAVAA